MALLPYVFASARKDVLRRLADPLALVLWMGIPLVLGGLITLATGGGGGGTPRVRVWIVDEDDSLVSGLLVGAMGQAAGGELFEIETLALEEAAGRLDEGTGSAYLRIPAGFGEALLLEEPCELELVTNPAQRIFPGTVEETLGLFVDAVFYLQRLVGEEIRTFADGPPPDAATFGDDTIAAVSVRINRTVERLEGLVFPPAIELETRVREEEDGEESGFEGLGFAALFFPSMLFMALFFTAQGLSEDVWQEKLAGTLRRAACAPHATRGWFLGKLLAGTALIGLVCAVAGTAGALAFDVPLGRAAAAVVWATGSGTIVMLVMTLLQLLATSQRGGSLVTNLVLFPMLMIGGAFFPFEAMPDWMAAIGRLTPNGWALEGLKELLYGAPDVAHVALDFGRVALAFAALFLVCDRRLATFLRSTA